MARLVSGEEMEEDNERRGFGSCAFIWSTWTW